jgi:hypothetical protein
LKKPGAFSISSIGFWAKPMIGQQPPAMLQRGGTTSRVSWLNKTAYEITGASLAPPIPDRESYQGSKILDNAPVKHRYQPRGRSDRREMACQPYHM